MPACRTMLMLVVIAAIGAVAPASVRAADVTVFAAASLKEAMDRQAGNFEAATGNKVVVSYASSNALARQIESGAPADLYISADLAWMDAVEQHHLIVPGTRVNLLRNAIVLIEPASHQTRLEIGPAFPLAKALGSGRLAMANPDSVPAGKYGKAALESLGVWPSVEAQVARAQNVRAALALVSRGEAPFGIVYRTDALADKGVRVVGRFPADSHPTIVYPAAMISTGSSRAARALLDFLRSPAAGATWEKYGFGVAK